MNADFDTAAKATAETIHAYLSGTLTASEAEAFEALMFRDDGVAAEVQRAIEIRAAMAGSESERAPVRRRGWRPLAAAAAIAMLAAGLYFALPPPEPLFRGAEERMGMTGRVEGRTLTARWDSVPEAASYEVRIFDDERTLLYATVTDGTDIQLVLPAANGEALPVDRYVLEVVALDNLGQVRMRSGRLRLRAAAQ